MRAKLRIAVWPSPAGVLLGTTEGDGMNRWLPPLNLIGGRTPWAAQVNRVDDRTGEGLGAGARLRCLTPRAWAARCTRSQATARAAIDGFKWPAGGGTPAR